MVRGVPIYNSCGNGLLRDDGPFVNLDNQSYTSPTQHPATFALSIFVFFGYDFLKVSHFYLVTPQRHPAKKSTCQVRALRVFVFA